MTMEKIYFTIAGTKHHYGQEYFEPKMEVKLVKEPDNEFDKEAIKTDRHGNCLSNDLSAYVSTAKSFVSYAEGILGSPDEIAKAKELIKAFDENSSAFYGYGIYTELASVIENINSGLGENGNTSDLAELLSDQAKIKRAYSGDYLETSEKLDTYLDGFPRSVLAKLFNLGK